MRRRWVKARLFSNPSGKARPMTSRLTRIFLCAFAMVLGAAAPAAAAPAPYKQELPVPAAAVPSSDGTYRMRLTQLQQVVHPDLPPTTVWGYTDGHSPPAWPGPTIVARRGTPTVVRWTNDLPATHLLPHLDPTMPEMTPAVAALTHLHGAFVAAGSDGNPYATDALLSGATQVTTYPNAQAATTLFYHDHVHGQTRLNVYAGLAGGYLLRDADDTGLEGAPLDVPGGAYELPLILQDRSFTADGQLYYSPGRVWIPEFFGDVATVNGAIQPYRTVEPRRYRLHLVNGSNARIYNLSFGSLKVKQIGSEGGLFAEPVTASRVLLHPGERADVVIDFSSKAGEAVTIKDTALPAGVVSPAKPLPGGVLQFRVGTAVTDADPGAVPDELPGEEPDLGAPSVTRDLPLEERLDGDGEPQALLIDGKRSMDPVDIKVKKGAVEDWRFVNLSADTHPMHIHLQQFQVIDRRPFDALAYDAALDAYRLGQGPKPRLGDFWTGPAIAPRATERGWKDTAGANPDQVLRVRIRFTLPKGASGPQTFALHCHILEHEDNDMMRPFQVR
jgi:spore coat protein A, manganese oxidase